jgi:hypothetical protein
MKSNWIGEVNVNALTIWYNNAYPKTEPEMANVTYFVFDKKSKGKLNIRHKVHLTEMEKINKYNIKVTHN